MERNIPHVLDIFTSSPGERRRARERTTEQFSSALKEQQKNAGSDSAVSLGSSEDEEDERNISKYFDYLNDHDNIRQKPIKEATNKKQVHESRIAEHEKDLKHIERHLSMKKTIRKKMMRDLQAAFVDNPQEVEQDPTRIPADKKNNIDLHNLTMSKRRMSKSEHSFLDMLKDEAAKEKRERHYKNPKTNKRQNKPHSQDDDSGNDSPSRSAFRSASKQDLLDTKDPKCSKEEKKPSLWKRLTGKSKAKR